MALLALYNISHLVLRFRGFSAGMEGEGHWILLDLDLVVVHVFTAETRALYDLENLWADAPRVPFTASDATAVAQKAKSDDWGRPQSSL